MFNDHGTYKHQYLWQQEMGTSPEKKTTPVQVKGRATLHVGLPQPCLHKGLSENRLNP